MTLPDWMDSDPHMIPSMPTTTITANPLPGKVIKLHSRDDAPLIQPAVPFSDHTNHTNHKDSLP